MVQYVRALPLKDLWFYENAVKLCHIGGYQICQKWLKDRKARTLSYGELTHYQRAVIALKETI